MQLQLAENLLAPEIAENFTFVPGVGGNPGTWIRDDQFDSLSDSEFDQIMDVLEDYQPRTMSELNGKRRRERKDQKKEKRDLRNEMKKAKIEKKKARGEFIKMKGEGKKAGSWSGEEGGEVATDIIGTVGGVVGNIFGKGDGGAVAPSESEETPFYKNPFVLIGGAVALGTIIFVLTRKK